jgi:hypothetical protein
MSETDHVSGAVIGPITTIFVTCRSDQATRTPNSASAWVAETMVEGRVYVVRSRHGAPNELARQLVAAGLADRPMVMHYLGRAGTTTWRSFHAAAEWTYSEGDQPLHRVRYREQPEGLFLVYGTGEKCVSSGAADVLEVPPADGRETHFPATRRCVGCESDFLPARTWSRFCSPTCRLRAHRRLAEKVGRRQSTPIDIRLIGDSQTSGNP